MNTLQKFQKPDNWPSLPLYKKISYYKTILDSSYSPFVDKLNVKEILPSFGLPDLKSAKLIRILKNPDDIDEKDLDTNNIIKSSHGSGWNIPITETTTIPFIKRNLHSWNKLYCPDTEKQYAFIEPRFFIEEKIDSLDYADVYMIRCIHGKPISVGLKEFMFETQNSYSVDWIPLSEEKFVCPKPQQLEKLLEYASVLSKPFEFVRIDFYLSYSGDIYFSEFTFTPAGGTQIFSDELEKEFGLLWL